MSDWTPEELHVIGSTGEIEVSPARPDGTPHSSTTIWVVRVGHHLYVRSYRGPAGSWLLAARRTHRARVRAGNLERDITFDEAAGVDPGAVDAAYRTKYGRSSYVDAMVTAAAAGTTLRIVPR